VAFPPYQL